MPASQTIADYLGRGTFAARPSSPSVPAGGTAIYYCTDTGDTYAWDDGGSSWEQVNAPAGAVSPSIVQVGCFTGSSIQGGTLGGAPVEDNVLLGFAGGVFPAPAANTSDGWVKVEPVDNGGSAGSAFYYKVCGASESATQNPIASAGNQCIAIVEINNGAPTPSQLNAYLNSTSVTLSSYPIPQDDALIIIAASNDTAAVNPTSFTGGNLEGTPAASNSRGMAIYSDISPAQGTRTYVANYSGSQGNRLNVITIK